MFDDEDADAWDDEPDEPFEPEIEPLDPADDEEPDPEPGDFCFDKDDFSDD